MSRIKSCRKEELRARLLRRDGPRCWLCGFDHLRLEVDPNSPDAMTIEHLVNSSERGSNRPANLVLVSFAGNQLLDNLTLVDKIKLRDEIRARLWLCSDKDCVSLKRDMLTSTPV